MINKKLKIDPILSLNVKISILIKLITATTSLIF